jgi:thiamine-phosphate pyrophosphorylase
VLEDQRLTVSLKTLRGRINRIVPHSLLEKRDAVGDVGREPYTSDEGQRSRVEDIFRANIKRTQEAVRCLEEFSKLIDPKLGRKFKTIRFELYELEKKIYARLIKKNKLDFTLYVVTDPQYDHFAVARKAIADGVKIIQLRDKKMKKYEYLKAAKKIAKMVKRSGAIFILNDYWDLIKKAGADGVHLGQEDIKCWPLKRVRAKIGEDGIIGVSTHSLSQARAAAKLGADYISVGPIFRTPSKPGVVPVGIKLLRKVLRQVKIPVIAIGGINQKNLEQVLGVGGKRVAVIRAAAEAKKLLALLAQP